MIDWLYRAHYRRMWMAHCHLSNAEFYDWLYKHAYPQDWKKEKRDREYQTALEKWKKNREQNFPPQDGTR